MRMWSIEPPGKARTIAAPGAAHRAGHSLEGRYPRADEEARRQRAPPTRLGKAFVGRAAHERPRGRRAAGNDGAHCPSIRTAWARAIQPRDSVRGARGHTRQPESHHRSGVSLGAGEVLVIGRLWQFGPARTAARALHPRYLSLRDP